MAQQKDTKKITVFTSTYNRAYILPKLYESLKLQTCKDFEWLVVDDGSEDETSELFDKWLEEDVIEIAYFKKKMVENIEPLILQHQKHKGSYFLL
ncbi:glycosyltransferase family 2 protein [Bacteroides fragilis]|nr:glycosyltransferase family 2 protein [Bacteroides fragilis]UVO85859.1 glycosyltransferase family 2 protein [Bacteroides fragilis]